MIGSKVRAPRHSNATGRPEMSQFNPTTSTPDRVEDPPETIPFHRLFAPRAIAILGVNRAPYGGTYFLRCYQQSQYPNPIYPINPKLAGETLFGSEVYGSIADVPADPPVDLAVVAVPARITPAVIEELGAHGVPFAHIFSSGYSEVGAEDLQRALLASARKANVRIVGPNCMGVYNPRAHLSFVEGSSLKPGNVAFVSQSGGLSGRMALNGPSREFYFSKIVSVGNQVDLDVVDFCRYFRDDPDTGILAIYVENVARAGHDLVSVLQDTTPRKPVIIWKGGVSETGHAAVMSHTGGLAGNYRIWQALARQTGTLLVNNFREMTKLVQGFTHLPVPETRGVAIITTGGGNSIELTDACERGGLEVPPLSREAQEKILEFIPPVNTNVRNPLDLGATGLDAYSYGRVMRVLASEPQVSSIMFVKDPERFEFYARNFGVPDYEDVLVKEIAAAKPPGKAVVSIPAIFASNEQSLLAGYSFQKKLLTHGIVTFDDVDAAVRCLHQMWRHGQARGHLASSPRN